MSGVFEGAPKLGRIGLDFTKISELKANTLPMMKSESRDGSFLYLVGSNIQSIESGALYDGEQKSIKIHFN